MNYTNGSIEFTLSYMLALDPRIQNDQDIIKILIEIINSTLHDSNSLIFSNISSQFSSLNNFNITCKFHFCNHFIVNLNSDILIQVVEIERLTTQIPAMTTQNPTRQSTLYSLITNSITTSSSGYANSFFYLSIVKGLQFLTINTSIYSMFNNKTMEQYSQIEYAIYSDIGANISNQVSF